jgi:hypothetical protein
MPSNEFSFCIRLLNWKHRPHEIASVSLARLIDIAYVSNKHNFLSIQKWSLEVIQRTVDQKPSPIFPPAPRSYIFSPPPLSPDSWDLPPCIAQIAQLLKLAHTCAHATLLSTMVNLLRQLMNVSIHYAYLSMALADRLDLRALRGVAYLEVMHRCNIVRRLGEPEQGGDSVLSPIHPAQRLKLLTGHFRLSRLWEELRAHPLPFEHSSSCRATWHQSGCTEAYTEWWKEKTRTESVLALGAADVVGRLRMLAKEFDLWGSATYMHHDCRLAAQRAVSDKIKTIEEALGDYFLED